MVRFCRGKNVDDEIRVPPSRGPRLRFAGCLLSLKRRRAAARENGTSDQVDPVLGTRRRMLLWLFSLALAWLHLIVVMLAIASLSLLQGAATLIYRLAPFPGVLDAVWLHSAALRRVFAYRVGLGGPLRTEGPRDVDWERRLAACDEPVLRLKGERCLRQQRGPVRCRRSFPGANQFLLSAVAADPGAEA